MHKQTHTTLVPDVEKRGRENSKEREKRRKRKKRKTETGESG